MIHDQHEPERVKKILSSSQRSAWMKAEELITKVAGIKPGMTVADLGCGAGIISIPVAMLVGDAGKVYAVDQKRDLLDHIKTQEPSVSLVTVKADVTDTKIPAGSVDVCFMVLILHEVPADDTLAEAYRILKPGGKGVILEWIEETTPNGPSVSERIGAPRMQELCRKAGFSGIETTDPWTENHYVLTATK